jgi:hypothetical protein
MTENIAIAVESPRGSGEAWGAIIGGALGAAAISVILLILGSGLGLSMVSPWSGAGASAAAVGVGTVIWLIVVQWVASAFGGYLTGRTRPRGEPSDEVFFRDTANGFLAWALATLLVAALLTSAVSAIIGAGAQVAATAVSGAAQSAGQAATPNVVDPTTYLVDSLYRPGSPDATAAAGGTAQPAAPADLRAETGRILVAGLAAQQFPADDLTYLAGQISAHAGVPADVAKQRVDSVVQKMQAAKADAQSVADAARKSAAKLSLYVFLSLIVGAFIAAAAAALGGIHRDEQNAFIRGVNRR